MEPPEDAVPSHFQAEHGMTPHCFVCNEEIILGDEVLLVRLTDSVVWRHQKCVDPEEIEEVKQRGA